MTKNLLGWAPVAVAAGLGALAVAGNAMLSKRSRSRSELEGGSVMSARDLEILDDKVRSFRSILAAWNLDYDRFPDIDAWLDANWTLKDGRETARHLLSNAMLERAGDLTGEYAGLSLRLQRDKDRQEAERMYRALFNQLRGEPDYDREYYTATGVRRRTY